MIRQKKKYRRPGKPFEKARIEAENQLTKKYGLKNKREIWKADFYIEKIRNQAKRLIVASEQQQRDFIDKLTKISLVKENSKIDDVLGLNKEDLLNRRLQTIVFKQGLAKTPKQARQFIIHRKVIVAGKVVDVPSYIISEALEKKISLRQRKEKPEEEKLKMGEESEKKEEPSATEGVKEANG